MADSRSNCAPCGFDAMRDLPEGFVEFLLPLHKEFTPRQQQLAAHRAANLLAAHNGCLPDHLLESAISTDWQIHLPEWCQDQRNQMTGPADDAELAVKMINSGGPGVMLDLEDSMANTWSNLLRGIDNTLQALSGQLTYYDAKRARIVNI